MSSSILELGCIYESTILQEYFVDNAKAYYMENDGEIHMVDSDHISQLIKDFDLSAGIVSYFESNFGEEPDWYKDWEWIAERVMDFKQEEHILFLVFDVVNKIVYVRGHKNDPNDAQRQSLIDFCISKNSELIYDPHAVA